MASGADVQAMWGLELDASGKPKFGGGGLVNKLLGYNQDISIDVERGIDRRGNLGTRGTARYSRGGFSGSLRLECDLVQPWLLELMFGSYTKTGTTKYTYTYTEADVLPSAEFQVLEQLTPSKTLFRQLQGCVVQRGEINVEATTSDPIRLSYEMGFARELRSNAKPSGWDGRWGIEDRDTVSFAGATWSAWTGSSYKEIAQAESVNISIDHGTELKTSLGSEFPTRASSGIRDWRVSTITLFEDPSTYMDALYGAPVKGTPSAPEAPKLVGGNKDKGLRLKLTWDDGGMMTFELTNVIVTTHSNPIRGAADELMESVEMLAGGCSLVVSDWPDDEPARK